MEGIENKRIIIKKSIDTSYMSKCLNTLIAATNSLKTLDKDSIEYDIYRTAAVKVFELILEQAGTLLKRALRQFFYSSKKADTLFFKDIFRHAAIHSLITVKEAENWIMYRDERNLAAHNYGEVFADDIIELLNNFIKDSKSLIKKLDKININDNFGKLQKGNN